MDLGIREKIKLRGSPKKIFGDVRTKEEVEQRAKDILKDYEAGLLSKRTARARIEKLKSIAEGGNINGERVERITSTPFRNITYKKLRGPAEQKAKIKEAKKERREKEEIKRIKKGRGSGETLGKVAKFGREFGINPYASSPSKPKKVTAKPKLKKSSVCDVPDFTKLWK